MNAAVDAFEKWWATQVPVLSLSMPPTILAMAKKVALQAFVAGGQYVTGGDV